jgi:hypothetical protein
MSKTAEQIQKEDDFKDTIINFILGEVDIDEIKEVDDNCGSLYIIMNDGKTYSVSLMGCESED